MCRSPGDSRQLQYTRFALSTKEPAPFNVNERSCHTWATRRVKPAGHMYIYIYIYILFFHFRYFLLIAATFSANVYANGTLNSIKVLFKTEEQYIFQKWVSRRIHLTVIGTEMAGRGGVNASWDCFITANKRLLPTRAVKQRCLSTKELYTQIAWPSPQIAWPQVVWPRALRTFQIHDKLYRRSNQASLLVPCLCLATANKLQAPFWYSCCCCHCWLLLLLFLLLMLLLLWIVGAAAAAAAIHSQPMVLPATSLTDSLRLWHTPT